MPAVFPILKIFHHYNVFLVSSVFLNLGISLAQGTIETDIETRSKLNVLLSSEWFGAMIRTA
jgi:hypothetical protein